MEKAAVEIISPATIEGRVPACAEVDNLISTPFHRDPPQGIVRIPINHIRDADSPRMGGVDIAHAECLAQLEVELPPILLQGSTMRVIDGMHRLTAARLHGYQEVHAQIVDVDDDEAFILAVRFNVAHGMPLSIADRRSAAARIIRARPHMSDRSIAHIAGLAAKTIARVRHELGSEPTARLGRDGRLRPVDSAAGRQAAADLIAMNPDATLREIAWGAGISVETARNVRERIRAGEDPVLDRRKRSRSLRPAAVRQVAIKLPETPAEVSRQLRITLEAIRRDPMMRYNEAGRAVLCWLGPRILIPDEIPVAFEQILPHCRLKIGELARSCATAWIQLALAAESDELTSAHCPLPFAPNPGKDGDRINDGLSPNLAAHFEVGDTRNSASPALISAPFDWTWHPSGWLAVAEKGQPVIAIADFLDELRQAGVQLWLQDGKLRYRPAGALDAGRLAVLRERRHELIAAVRAEANAPATRPDTIPLSPHQQGIWFLDHLGLLGPAYQYSQLYRITGDLDVAAVRSAITEIVRRHEILRTSFPMRDGTGVQVVAPAGESRFTYLDVSDLPAAERDRWLAERKRGYVEHRFDLNEARCFYTELIRLTPTEHMLVFRSHHLVIDGPSQAILFFELRTLYAAYRTGAPSPLPELTMQYADYALWQHHGRDGVEAKRQMEYWRQRLGDAPGLDLPTDRPRPTTAELAGDIVEVAVSPATVDGLRRLARREGVTLFMVLLAAFHTLLYRWSGQSDVSIGLATDARARGDVAANIGHFINTVVLRAEVPGRRTFVELLGEVRSRLLEALEHRHVPIDHLVAELRPQRNLAVQPLFQVMFTYLVAESLDLDGLAVTQLEPDERMAMFDLMLFGSETAVGDFNVGMEYQTALFERATMERLAGYLVNLLAAVVDAPDAPIDDLPLMSDAQRHEMLDVWNDTATPFDADICLHQLIERQVVATPDATALVLGDRALTYRELDERANALAWHLRGLGVGPDDRVGIALPRSLETVIANVAVLKAGGACVPIDPTYPSARQRLIADDAALRLLIRPSADGGEPDEAAPPVPVLALDEFGAQARTTSPENLADPASIAWVLYTSGSTGRPKGVAMPHRSLVNQVQWQWTQGAGGRGRTLQWAALSFDVCFQEMLTTLTVGEPLVLVSEEVRHDFQRLLDVIETHRIERIFMPFVALQGFAELATRFGRVPSSLRAVTTAGEQLQATPAIRAFFEQLPDCTLYNQYGPTEVHVATAYELRGAPAQWPALPPIGRPYANVRVYVLDAELRPVPPGVSGELFIGGIPLARGYLGRPELTAERFLPDPFNVGGRMYRTGDRVRWNADGELKFLGRFDDQVKIRGFGVEVAEIEAALSGSPQVRDCAVAAHRYGVGDRRLVAYVVPDSDAPPTATQLRAFLAARLPDFMVPAIYLTVAQLPRTPSGKLSRALLPPPAEDAERAAAADYEPPRTPLQECIASVWAEVLAVPRVGLRDNFFELGGHSLLAVAVATRLTEVIGQTVALRTLFEGPTVADLAERLADKEPV